jgi:hypothetical protein
MQSMGPWRLGKCIYTVKGKSSVYEVTSHTLKTDDKWLVKVKDNTDALELYTLLSLNIEAKPPNMVELCKDPFHKFGMTPENIWYAMKKYDGHLKPEHAASWREIAKAALGFIKVLHKTYQYIYMDFRMENILVDGDKFVIADYDNVTRVEMVKLRKLNRYNRWYYMARGGEPDQWAFSWKMDLMSLAYLLINLTSDEGKAICEELIQRRQGDHKSHMSMREFAKRRNALMYDAANPSLKKYLDIMKEVKWNTFTPPPYDIYTRLLAIFE